MPHARIQGVRHVILADQTNRLAVGMPLAKAERQESSGARLAHFLRVVSVLGVLNQTPAWSQPAEERSTPNIATRIQRAETGEERDHLTGDWQGLRTKLVDRGVHFSAGYTGEFLSNVHGGNREGSVFQGLVEMGLDIDPSKFSAWNHALLHVSSLYPHGASPSGQLLGDLSTASNLDAYDSWVLFELWLDQAFWQDRFSLRLGQLSADEEFVTSETSALFMNSTFGWPSFIAWNTPSPSYPLAAPGVRLRYQGSDRFMIHAGVWDGQADPDDSHGTGYGWDSQEGVFAMGEAAWHTAAGPDSYPGTYKLGAWHHTGGFEPLFDPQPGLNPPGPSTGPLPEQSGDVWGFYLVADQQVWREPDADPETNQGLAMFLRFSSGPATRNPIDYYLDAGAVYRGLLPGREADSLGLGLAYAHLGRQARDLARTAGAPAPDFEAVLELTYEMEINTWWRIQPGLQYIIHPGGQTSRPNAFVLGLRTSFVL